MLALIFSAVGILGGAFGRVDWLGVDSGSYLVDLQSNGSIGIKMFSMVLSKSIVVRLSRAGVFFWGFLAAPTFFKKGGFLPIGPIPTSEVLVSATTETVVFLFVRLLGIDSCLQH